MNKLALALAATGAFALGVPTAPATASMETYEARVAASGAAAIARDDMIELFGKESLKPGKYLWRDVPENAGEERVVISLDNQLAYLYRGNSLVGAASISTGRDGHPTPPGIFNVLEKKTMHRSRKYDNAPMPFMQRIDRFGIALHAGHNPGHPASHGCIRLPSEFAKKLFAVTKVGTPVLIGA
jgi:lipoprotein-anchoring transpeptidase ErfK/SrfK